MCLRCVDDLRQSENQLFLKDFFEIVGANKQNACRTFYDKTGWLKNEAAKRNVAGHCPRLSIVQTK